MMMIPFYRASVTDTEINEVVECLKSGWLTTGPRTKHFESDFAHYMRQKHAVALNSCTAALHLALEAVGTQAGDTVVVPTMTFAATAEVVRYFNADPLLVDCRESDSNMDVTDAERRLGEHAKQGQKVTAILPVHYGGQIGDARGIKELAQKRDLKIIEDAAHCCPAFYRDSEAPMSGPVEQGNGAPELDRQKENGWLRVGAEADITCFSFYANKCITTGEGGMACTQNDAYADRMRIMSLHGISKDAWKRFTSEGSWSYEIVAPGFKYNLTDVAAAIGIHQLRRAEDLHRKRIQSAELYTQLLKDIEELILPCQFPDRIHSWHLYAIRLKLNRLKIKRSEFIDELKKCGVATSVHWMPLHMHPYYREKYGYKPDDFPIASRLYSEIISLPLYPEMTEADVTYVSDTVRKVIVENYLGF